MGRFERLQMRITERRAGAVERSETRLSRVGKKESRRRTLYPAANDSLLATPMGFEPTISTVTGWHVNRYTTGPRAEEAVPGYIILVGA